MDTEYLVVNEGSNGEVVKQIGEVAPYVGIAVLSHTLTIESIDLLIHTQVHGGATTPVK